MRNTGRFAPQAFLVAVVAAVLGASPACAIVSTGEPAALLVFPLITVDDGTGADTLIQLGNADDAAVAVRCAYEEPQGPSPGAPRFTPFTIQLLASQPVAWRVSAGLDAVPGNGGAIPPLASPFTGVLRCVAADDAGKPAERNVLIGSATLERFVGSPPVAVDSAQYDATGFDALPGSNGDTELMLGGPAAEYAGCPESIVLQSFFDGALLDLGSAGATQRELSTTLTLVTCAQNPLAGTGATLNFTVVNEFGQQLSTSRPFTDQLVVPLSRIDTETPSASIFNVNRQGSLGGTIRITPTGGGVLAVAVVTHTDPSDATRRATTAVSPQLDGERSAADIVQLASATPAPTCVGDCDGNGMVAINELIAGVTIALGNQPLSICPSFDANSDGQVAINELITAVTNALVACQQ